jgi:hypothetical protein
LEAFEHRSNLQGANKFSVVPAKANISTPQISAKLQIGVNWCELAAECPSPTPPPGNHFHDNGIAAVLQRAVDCVRLEAEPDIGELANSARSQNAGIATVVTYREVIPGAKPHRYLGNGKTRCRSRQGQERAFNSTDAATPERAQRCNVFVYIKTKIFAQVSKRVFRA